MYNNVFINFLSQFARSLDPSPLQNFEIGEVCNNLSFFLVVALVDPVPPSLVSLLVISPLYSSLIPSPEHLCSLKDALSGLIIYPTEDLKPSICISWHGCLWTTWILVWNKNCKEYLSSEFYFVMWLLTIILKRYIFLEVI